MANYLATSWGIKLGDDLVIDPSVNPPVVAVANSYGDHEITNKLNKVTTIFPTSRSIEVGTVPATVTQTPLVQTSSSAWGETDFNSIQNNTVAADPATDNIGPVIVAMAATDSATKARLVLVGDADFASDQYFTQYANGDFAINSIDWAANQENLISLTPKQTTSRYMAPPEGYIMGLILLGSVFLLPALVIIAGVFTFIQRRRRG